MPELPEVEALAAYLRERAVGHTVDRIEVAAISALKTYDPPVSAVAGAPFRDAARHGKFLDLSIGDFHLVVHLARAGWLHYREALSPAPLRPSGKGPIALRVRLDDGSGFDLTEAGTQKKLAAYLVRDPSEVPGVSKLGPDARHELLERERLDHVVVCPEVQAFDLLLDLAACRQQDHGQLRLLGSDRPKDLEPVLLGKEDIEQHQPEVAGQSLRLRRLPISHARHGIALRSKPALDEVGDRALVLDDQDAHDRSMLGAGPGAHDTA